MTDTTADTATSTDTTTTTATIDPAKQTTTATVTETVDHAAEAEKWKQLAQKHEQRAKTNAEAAKELEKVKQASMSDQEKAVEQARAETRAETLKQLGSKLVDAELKVALAGKALTPDALLTFDRSAFLTDDGDVDTEAIKTWVGENTTDGGLTAPSFDGGARTTSAKPGDMSSLIRKAAGLA